MIDIVVPIFAQNLELLIGQSLDAKSAGATMVEIRLDRCAQLGADCAAIVAGIPSLLLPVMATNRSADEGGAWKGTESERLQILLDADAAGAAYIDVELAHVQSLSSKPQQAKLILSYHDFKGMGSDLNQVVTDMYAAGADVAKVAVTAADSGDLAVIETLYHDFSDRNDQQSLVAIAMGEEGLPSRLLAGAWGAAFTFGTINGQDSAPGQPSVEDLIDMYNIQVQGPETRIFGIIGEPVSHSLSPVIHNSGFQALQIDAVYVPFLVHNPKDFWLRCGDWIDGLSITIPHKHDLGSKVDTIEDIALHVGAINTVYRTVDSCIGANTDACAAVHCIQECTGTIKGLRCMILGAGGVSRAMAYALHQKGAKVCIANRTVERAQQLAEEVGCQFVSLDEATANEFDVLINGTSVGMNSELSPWPQEFLKAHHVVFDTVYTPLETTLLQYAQKAGATPICGLSMFLRQAYEQFERWTNTPAPEEAMRRLFLEKLGIDPYAFVRSAKTTTGCWNNG